jgi:hypothetical protein
VVTFVLGSYTVLWLLGATAAGTDETVGLKRNPGSGTMIECVIGSDARVTVIEGVWRGYRTHPFLCRGHRLCDLYRDPDGPFSLEWAHKRMLPSGN